MTASVPVPVSSTDDTVARLACPECQTLNLPSAGGCLRCELEFGWLREFAAFRDTLLWSPDRRREDRLRWRVELSWHGRRWVELTETDLLVVEQHLPNGGTLRLERDAAARRLDVTVDGTTETVSLPLDLQREALGIRSWCTLEPLPATELPPMVNTRGKQRTELRSSPTTIGRRDDCRLRIADPAVDECHAIVVSPKGSEACWISDCGSTRGTHVNRRRVRTRRLRAGDIVQIAFAGFAYSESDRHLHRISPIDGVRLELRGVQLRHSASPINLTIEPGQFVVIRGESGSGKTTLLKALVGTPGLRTAGSIVATVRGQSFDLDLDRDGYRKVLGYVSQDSVLHKTLTPRQALAFARRLRVGPGSDDDAEDRLMQLELKRDSLDRPIELLSGGEDKRVRTAVELVHQPGLLVLDEPDSGLDAALQDRLMRQLHALALQGCTIVMISHGPAELLRFADRVVELSREGIRIVERSQDGLPSANDVASNADSRTVDEIGPVANAGAPTAGTLPSPHPASGEQQPPTTADIDSTMWRPGWRERSRLMQTQFSALWQREVALLRCRWRSRIVLPTVLVPLLFALAVGGSVPHRGGHETVLGFLAILSTIWMSASLSLLSIAGEREVFNHEHLLFLRVTPYVAAKTAVSAVLSLVQTGMFWTLLCFIRAVCRADRLHDELHVGAVLALVGLAGAGMGLLLSAIAGRKREIATFLLPLIVLIQMVCSVQIAVGDRLSLPAAYRSFQLFHRPGPARGAAESDAVPARPVVAFSYLTVSRPADIALRAFAYSATDAKNFTAPADRSSPETRTARAWHRRALLTLAAFALLFPALAAATLSLQSRRPPWHL